MGTPTGAVYPKVQRRRGSITMDNYSRKSWSQQLRTVAPLTVMILIIAACSSSEDDASTGTTAPTPVRTTTTPAIEAPTTTTPATTQEAPTATSEATSTFDGSGCTYDGPTEFDLNTEVTFTFINTSDGSAGYGIWKVPEGTTVGDITEKSIFGIGADRTPDMRAVALPSSPGIDKELVVALDTSGLWAVNCFTPDADLGVDYPATVFVVSDN